MVPFCPSNIHQILITDATIGQIRLPPVLEMNVASLQKAYPKANYKLWLKDEIDDFIATHFESDVADCFRALAPYAYKADLARLCIAYQLGGLYCDLGIRLISPISPPEGCGILAYQDVQNNAPYCFTIINSIFWCDSGRVDLAVAIEQIVRNFKDEFYGPTPLYPTGPVVFGSSIVKGMANCDYRNKPNEYYIGSVKVQQLNPFTKKNGIFFVSPDGTVNATRTQSISQLKDAGIKTNDYGKFWRSKQVYSEKTLRWHFFEAQIQLGEIGVRTKRGIVSRKESHGLLTFGPYIGLEQGTYVLETVLSSYDHLPNMQIEIVSGPDQLATRHYVATASADMTAFLIEFSLQEAMENVEFKVFCFGPFSAEILEFILHKR